MNNALNSLLQQAEASVAHTWPAHTFVASNPLSGLEHLNFEKALESVAQTSGVDAFPSSQQFEEAYVKGHIHTKVLEELLQEKGYHDSVQNYVEELKSEDTSCPKNPVQELDQVMVKWLAAFLDEGLAEWEMPYKTEGFYAAWRLLAPYDKHSGAINLKHIPKTSREALEYVLGDEDEAVVLHILKQQLAQLPGWVGYIKQRQSSGSEWQEAYPISLEDYLGVRLLISKQLDIPLLIDQARLNIKMQNLELKQVFLQAWEKSWQSQLLTTLEKNEIDSSDKQLPDAQMVFCIDTRSEAIRKHIESTGNYETFGYAGFFGITMDYQSPTDGVIRKSCPPIVPSSYRVTEISQKQKETQQQGFQKKTQLNQFVDYFAKRMKNMLPSAFGYVEGTGWMYGGLLLFRSFFAKQAYHNKYKDDTLNEQIHTPLMKRILDKDIDLLDISLEEKAGIVKSAFDLMGWEQFAPLILFVGHGSHSSNNPFHSSLDCGACAASPGRHNARMLAKLANLPEVRRELRERHQIEIPNDTVFIGAEHNTATDEIVLFDSEISTDKAARIQKVKSDLHSAQLEAAKLKTGLQNGINTLKRKAGSWDETRPEWGLAKNAGFIIGERALTKDTDLNGRCFLHSYNWKLDPTGKLLEGIMQGPMTVTQWINNHYYFSTVQNTYFGSGSKTTLNVTGKFGVVQGNGGDLKRGLPKQSLVSETEEAYHEPLRLSVVIHAPIARVSQIIVMNSGILQLLNNQWIHLLVKDPEQNNKVFRYLKSVNWEEVNPVEAKELQQTTILQTENS